MKKLLKWMRGLFSPSPLGVPREEFDMTDQEFLVHVVRLAPSGSVLSFDECEPRGWGLGMADWAAYDDKGKARSGCYEIRPGFADVLSGHVSADPAGLKSCHHITISGPNREEIMTSFDNFQVLYLALDIQERLKELSTS